MILTDGKWARRRAFIIGGGPSLKSFDWSLLSGELCLGTNMAFLHGPCANLVSDISLMDRLMGDSRWHQYRGVKVWLNSEAPLEKGRYPDVLELPECVDMRCMPAWSRSLAKGLYRSTNTGASALNLVDVLGANPIYLLGFDMVGAGLGAGKTDNWHNEYAEKKKEDWVYRTFIEDFEKNLKNIRASVYNLNPASKLKCFPFAGLEEVFGLCKSPS
jgi:hypothetical protein